jgi:hypothetical protein
VCVGLPSDVICLLIAPLLGCHITMNIFRIFFCGNWVHRVELETFNSGQASCLLHYENDNAEVSTRPSILHKVGLLVMLTDVTRCGESGVNSQNKHNRTLNCIIINFQSLAVFYGFKGRPRYVSCSLGRASATKTLFKIAHENKTSHIFGPTWSVTPVNSLQGRNKLFCLSL